MQRAARLAACAALIAAFGTACAEAPNADVNANASAKDSPADAAVSQAVEIQSTAAGLAAYGHKAQNAAALVAAASLLMDNPPSATRTLDEGTTEGGSPSDSKSGDVADLDPAALLAAAAEMSTDGHLKAFIAGMQSGAVESKGSTTGPGSTSRRIEANSTHSFTIDMRGGEYGRIDVRGDGDTDLDCWLYDDNGNLIDSDTDYTDWCILEVVPAWTGRFRVQVSNLGSVWNGAVISWN